jgi:hypothetical protein
MNEYKIGDTVWIPVGGLRGIDVPCPVCFGKLVVRLELGNSDIVVLPCEYCGKGYEGPRGVVGEYTRAPAAEPFTITSINKEETDAGTSVEYRSGSGYAKKVYATREEAMVRAEEMAAENEAIERKRADYAKHNTNRNYAWNAGYHMHEARKAADKIEWHTKMAQLCKAKQKEVTP